MDYMWEEDHLDLNFTTVADLRRYLLGGADLPAHQEAEEEIFGSAEDEYHAYAGAENLLLEQDETVVYSARSDLHLLRTSPVEARTQSIGAGGGEEVLTWVSVSVCLLIILLGILVFLLRLRRGNRHYEVSVSVNSAPNQSHSSISSSRGGEDEFSSSSHAQPRTRTQKSEFLGKRDTDSDQTYQRLECLDLALLEMKSEMRSVPVLAWKSLLTPGSPGPAGLLQHEDEKRFPTRTLNYPRLSTLCLGDLRRCQQHAINQTKPCLVPGPAPSVRTLRRICMDTLNKKNTEAPSSKVRSGEIWNSRIPSWENIISNSAPASGSVDRFWEYIDCNEGVHAHPRLQRDLVDPNLQRRNLVDPTELQRDLVNLTIQQRDLVDPTRLQRDLVDPTGLQRNLMDSTGLQTDLVDPTGIQRDIVDLTGLERDLVDPTGLQNPLKLSYPYFRLNFEVERVRSDHQCKVGNFSQYLQSKEYFVGIEDDEKPPTFKTFKDSVSVKPMPDIIRPFYLHFENSIVST